MVASYILLDSILLALPEEYQTDKGDFACFPGGYGIAKTIRKNQGSFVIVPVFRLTLKVFSFMGQTVNCQSLIHEQEWPAGSCRPDAFSHFLQPGRIAQ